MFCPHCNAAVQSAHCSACGRSFDMGEAERLGQLTYLLDTVDVWRKRGLLNRATAAAITTETRQELAVLRERLHGAASAPASPSRPRIRRQLRSDVGSTAEHLMTPPTWAQEGQEEGASEAQGAEAPRSPSPSSIGASTSAPPPVASASMPSPSVAAAPTGSISGGTRATPDVLSDRPRLVWRQVGLSLLSDRALNTLLLVGALLVLASATVISTLNPTHLSAPIHLAVMAATTAAFFASGQALRTRLGLVRSGSTLLTISAAFLPLDIWTLGQGDLLRQTVADTALTASAVCLVVYLLVHVFLREHDKLFALLAAVAGASTALALANRVALPPNWWASVLIVLAIVYALAAPRLRAFLPTLASTLLFTAHALTLGSLSVLTLAAAAAFAGIALETSPGVMLAATWWLGTLFYTIYGRIGGERYYLSVAGSLSAVAALITLQLLPVLGPWTGVAIAALACVYMTIGARHSRHGAAAPEPKLAQALRVLLGQWPYQVALALSAVALLWPIADALSRAVAAGVLSALYALSTRHARDVRGPLWGAVSVTLLPLTLLYLELALPTPDPLPAWTLLALGAVVLGEAAVRRAGGVGMELWSWASVWQDRALSPFARPLLGLGYLTTTAVLSVYLARDLTYPTISNLLMSPTEGLDLVTAALAVLTVAAALVALLQAAPRSFFVAAALSIAPIVSVAVALGKRFGWSDVHVVQSGALMGLALLYLVAAVWLESRIENGPAAIGRDGRATVGARALFPLAYALSALATLLVVGDPPALEPIFGLLLAVWAWSAYRVATGRHTLFLALIAVLFSKGGIAAKGSNVGATAGVALFGYLCAWLFPVWLLVAFTSWLPADSAHAVYGLALSVVAALYLTGARYLARAAPVQSWPWLSAGAALIVLGPLLAVTEALPRLLSTGLALGVCLAMARLTKRPEWLIEAALALPLLVFALLNVSGASLLDLSYYPLVFLPVFMLCLVISNRLRHDGPANASSWPFDVVGYGGLCHLPLAIPLSGAFYAPLTAVLTATAYTLLLFAYTESSGKRVWPPQIPLQSIRWSAWLSVICGFWTLEASLRLFGLEPSLHPIGWAVAALAVTALTPRSTLVWRAPLGWGAVVAASICSFWALMQTEAAPGHANVQILLITLALAGLQAVTVGYQRRERGLIYGGIAAILGVYLGQLALAAVTQPQFFVGPVGLYLLGVAFAERRLAPRQAVRKTLEITGLLLLLGTSLLQALGYATAGLPVAAYDLVVLVEGLILLWVGDTLRWKDTLLAGALALIADALLIFAHPLRAVNTWYAVAVAGLAIIAFVIVVEKKRQSFAKLFGQWRQMRETWD